jgi:hypothetical protein
MMERNINSYRQTGRDKEKLDGWGKLIQVINCPEISDDNLFITLEEIRD